VISFWFSSLRLLPIFFCWFNTYLNEEIKDYSLV
jgi:hypothetical protein